MKLTPGSPIVPGKNVTVIMTKGTVLYAGLPEISVDHDQYFAEEGLSQNATLRSGLSFSC